MFILALTLSLLYLYIRLKFKSVISNNKNRKEVNYLIIGNAILVVSGILIYFFPLLDFPIPLVYLGVLTMFIPSVLNNHNIISKVLLILLAIATLIPFVNIVSLLVLTVVLLILGYKNSSIMKDIGVVILTLGTEVVIISSLNDILWLSIALVFIIKHVQHTDQLLNMMRNAGKNVVTDTLTGLYNRRWLYRRLEKLLELDKVGVIFCDIDNFKNLNDEKGHEHGDYVLEKTGEIMKRVLQGSGYAARYGGEEFVGIVTDYGRTQGLAEKLLNTVKKELNITMSIGIAIEQSTAEECLKLADERMYISKTTGKDKITFNTTEIETEGVSN
ncbi:TPA: GGDEF domain-containing protein [Salmonella enterica subsp. enterica serovar Typhi str. AG3]|nr:GGDEF domain-containing protein [Salmonella enterica subsp. enterica serovar Typhi str. AG3]